MNPIFDAIRELLDERELGYRALEHEPTPTSEDSARVRGEPLEIGGKALSMRADGSDVLLVLSAARRFNSKAFRKAIGAKKLRFLTRDELHDACGLVPGSVPPFGRPLLPFDLYLDASVVAQSRIAFNAGSLRRSIIMDRVDYQAVAKPVALVDVTQSPAT